MREVNKIFFDRETFQIRVEHVMKKLGMDYSALCDRLNNEGIGYGISKNNLRLYISHRAPNLQFLIALSKALAVSIDYLLNVNCTEELIKGFDYKFDEYRYKKYCSQEYAANNKFHNIYFYNTVTGEKSEIIAGKLIISRKSNYCVKMIIPTHEGGEKIYEGTLLLSDSMPSAFINLYSDIGEMVSITFYDAPLLNIPFKLAIAAVISISSGDFKRSPVMSRMVISSFEIPKDNDALRANLLLNTKEIHIKEDALKLAIDKFCENNDIISDSSVIKSRILDAFKTKYTSIEENFILNTIKKDFDFSQENAEMLVTSLKLHSLERTNSKINRALESRLFSLVKKYDAVQKQN